MKFCLATLVAVMALVQMAKTDASGKDLDRIAKTQSSRRDPTSQRQYTSCVQRCTSGYGDVRGGGLLTTVQDVLHSVLSVLVGDRGLVSQLLRTLGLGGTTGSDNDTGGITLLIQKLRAAGVSDLEIRQLLVAIAGRGQFFSGGTRQRRPNVGVRTARRGQYDAGFDGRKGGYPVDTTVQYWFPGGEEEIIYDDITDSTWQQPGSSWPNTNSRPVMKGPGGRPTNIYEEMISRPKFNSQSERKSSKSDQQSSDIDEDFYTNQFGSSWPTKTGLGGRQTGIYGEEFSSPFSKTQSERMTNRNEQESSDIDEDFYNNQFGPSLPNNNRLPVKTGPGEELYRPFSNSQSERKSSKSDRQSSDIDEDFYRNQFGSSWPNTNRWPAKTGPGGRQTGIYGENFSSPFSKTQSERKSSKSDQQSSDIDEDFYRQDTGDSKTTGSRRKSQKSDNEFSDDIRRFQGGAEDGNRGSHLSEGQNEIYDGVRGKSGNYFRDQANQEASRRQQGAGADKSRNDFFGRFGDGGQQSDNSLLYDKENSRHEQKSNNSESQYSRRLKQDDFTSDALRRKSNYDSNEAAYLQTLGARLASARANRERSRLNEVAGTEAAARGAAIDASLEAEEKKYRALKEESSRKEQQRLLDYEDQGSEKQSQFSDINENNKEFFYRQ